MGAKSALKKTYKILNKSRLAKKLGVSYQSLDRWLTLDRLPDTDYSNKTKYARQIEIITEGKVTVEELLGFRPPHQTVEND